MTWDGMERRRAERGLRMSPLLDIRSEDGTLIAMWTKYGTIHVGTPWLTAGELRELSGFTARVAAGDTKTEA